MDLPADELSFLRDLVKTSRQRSHHLKWIDRDGTTRITALNQAETLRLNDLARRLRLSPVETLRQTAHIPAARTPPPATPPPAAAS